jgi:clan AA aspartic protease
LSPSGSYCRTERRIASGEVIIPVLLENLADRLDASAGRLSEDRVRRVLLDMTVDTGATSMLLPQEVVDELGLEVLGSTNVAYADERRATLPIAGRMVVTVAGRQADARCIVGPRGSEPLLGQLVLEETDLLVDCRRGTLTPRPDSPDLPLQKLK